MIELFYSEGGISTFYVLVPCFSYNGIHIIDIIIDWKGYSRDRKREMCGECDDFMWSDVATCGYCGCFFHSKKDDRFSSDSVWRHQEVSTSEAGPSGRASPEN